MASVGRRVGRVAAVVGALLLIAEMAACSAESPGGGSGPYAAEFEQARRNAVTDFQREVLSDDQITDAEFREVRQRYVDCVADAGMHVVAQPNGQYDFSPGPANAEQEAAERRCSDETTYVIEPLYYLLQVNPDNEDFSALIVECLRQQGVVDDAFTKEDWDRFVNAFAAQFNAADGAATGDATVPPADLPTLPGGVAMDDSRVQQCSSNPLAL